MSLKNVALLFLLAGGTGFTTPLFATQAQDLTAFITCVTTASGPQWSASTGTCTLPYYSTPYLISSQINITSGSVRYISTGSGGVASTYPQATLQRDFSSVSGTPSPFYILYANSSTHNLVIESLIINGNRTGKNANGVEVLNCLPTFENWVDVELLNAGYGTGTWPGVSVYDVTFQYSPGIALVLGQYAYAYYNWFYYQRINAIYTSPNDAINDNTMEYTGVEAVAVNGSNVLVEYNTLFQDQDEWPYGQAGGQLYVGPTASTNFTFLSNVINGNYASCPAGQHCTTVTGCTVPNSNGAVYNEGIEVWMGGGTYNNNEIQKTGGHGLVLGNVDGSTITTATGWNSLSSTTAGQAVKLLNNDPNWTSQQIESNTFNGVIMLYVAGQGPNFGGNFSFNDLRSENNAHMGFAWTTSLTPKSGTTLSWGSANAACLTGNAQGAIGPMPSGFSGPASTTTCP